MTFETVEQYQRWADETLSLQQAMFPPPACPAWCGLPNGHSYDRVEHDGEMTRHHNSAPEAFAAVWDVEQNRHGEIGGEVFGIEISAECIKSESELTSDQARALASELVAAADLLDEITGVQR
ncbi:MAG TPA: hypothetical protein VHV79_03155 [Mycobacteriales bacterium]|jgi:hypothetical protein|nr:hypothetical protein [Mycobacteriales bacterium]